MHLSELQWIFRLFIFHLSCPIYFSDNDLSDYVIQRTLEKLFSHESNFLVFRAHTTEYFVTFVHEIFVFDGVGWKQTNR